MSLPILETGPSKDPKSIKYLAGRMVRIADDPEFLAPEDKPYFRRKLEWLSGELGYTEWTTGSCSGCLEEEDGYPVPYNGYPGDEKAGCYLGGGCDECGYQGKRRTPFFVPVRLPGSGS